jgi:translation initiation factor 2B subunit (eIF-2B alpha/beta/delta family)
MNGAASIHDFEIAIAGQTSEDVEAVLPDGRFGAAEETGREMNLAIVEGRPRRLGMGEALGKRLEIARQAGFCASLLLRPTARRRR